MHGGGLRRSSARIWEANFGENELFGGYNSHCEIMKHGEFTHLRDLFWGRFSG
jgi:hypothetical protein